MAKIEHTIETLDKKLVYWRDVYSRKHIFKTGICILDRRMGPFSKSKKYLFVASKKNGLAPLYRAILYNTNLIYGTNVTSGVFAFKHLQGISEGKLNPIPNELLTQYDAIIVLQLENYRENFDVFYGKLIQADLNFTIFKHNDKPKTGKMILYPNINKVSTVFSRKEKFSRLKNQFFTYKND